MSKKSIPRQILPSKLHPRNRHQGRYDLPRLMLAEPSLAEFVSVNLHGVSTLDFANPAAVRSLNRALLKDCYGILGWDIGPNNLCPPVPGRVDYLHYLADLMAASNGGRQPRTTLVLDIGTGANCIYPLLGASEYGWRFVASDIDSSSLENAARILAANPNLAERITLRLQNSSSAIFSGIVLDDDWFDVTLCNPPFHASLAEADQGSQRKWQNLGKTARVNEEKTSKSSTSPLNFGGQANELCCPGGELAFIEQMIKESTLFATRSFWFTTLVSKSANLPAIYAALKAAKVLQHQTIQMGQGQKQSRFVAWTFLHPAQQTAWRKLRW